MEIPNTFLMNSNQKCFTVYADWQKDNLQKKPVNPQCYILT